MIRFYKLATKMLRTLKSYLTGAVLKIVLFSYNVFYVMSKSLWLFAKFLSKRKAGGMHETDGEWYKRCKKILDDYNWPSPRRSSQKRNIPKMLRETLG